MDAIERAIRTALAKGEADDRAFRIKVYRSVFAALERNIAASPQLAPEAAQRRRDTLKARIVEVEKEFVPAIENDPPRGDVPTHAAPAVDFDERDPAAAAGEAPPVPDVGLRGADPRFDAGPSPRIHMAPDDRNPVGGGPVADRREMPEGRPRRRLGLVLIVVVLAAIIALLGWIGFELGLIAPPAPPGTAAQQPAGAQADPGPDAPALGPGTADAAREWITVFSPKDPTSVVAPSGAQAEIVDEAGTAFIRIRSGRDGEAVLFDVGQGILERLAGRHAVFDIVARAQDDSETQISIDCNFGALGDCGRRRYMVGPGRADYLFDVDLPDARPGAAGTIAVTSDVGSGGKAIDIFEIRVSLSD